MFWLCLVRLVGHISGRDLEVVVHASQSRDDAVVLRTWLFKHGRAAEH